MPATLAGCSESKSAKTEEDSPSARSVSTKPYYQRMLEKGLDAVANDDINKAQSYFENAVDSNGKSKKARMYLKQAKFLNQAMVAYKSGDYVTARAALGKVPDNENTSSALTTKVQQLSDKIGERESLESDSQATVVSSNQVTSSSSTEKVSAEDHKVANSVRDILASNQGFSKSVLRSIPDSEILTAARAGGTATNAGLAQTAGTLLKQYPQLK